jgi:hypothetical protein
MLVEDMRHRMTAAEYLGWYLFYQRKAQRQELEIKRAGG